MKGQEREKGELARAGSTELKWKVFFPVPVVVVVEASVLGHLPRHMQS